MHVDPYSAALGYRQASFIKIRNISLGYNFDSKMFGKSGISQSESYISRYKIRECCIQRLNSLIWMLSGNMEQRVYIWNQCIILIIINFELYEKV